MTALRAFLLSVVPSGVRVVLGQANRVPEPAETDFVVMTPIRRSRLATNTDTSEDVSFHGTVAGSILTVTDVTFGVLAVGQALYDVTGLLTTIVALGTGTGGVGTYTLAATVTPTGTALWAGATSLMMPTMVTVQLDVHGPSASDNSGVISMMFRDPYATSFFAGVNASIQPLYADEARQLPFINAEKQFEDRWVVEATLQVNESVSTPQQFADQLVLNTSTSVQAEFPAA